MIGTPICEFSSPKTVEDLKVNVTLAFHRYFRDASGKYFLLDIEEELWVAPDFFVVKLTELVDEFPEGHTFQGDILAIYKAASTRFFLLKMDCPPLLDPP